MLNRSETKIAVAATLGPLALIGALTLSSHDAPPAPSPAITVQPAPVYVPAPTPEGRQVISA